MMWDIQDENNNNITSNNCNNDNKDSLREQVFHWPQHSFLIEHFRDHGATLGAGLREKLQKLDIYTGTLILLPQSAKSISGRPSVMIFAVKCPNFTSILTVFKLPFTI